MRKRRTRVALARQNLSERVEVRARIAGELAQTEDELATAAGERGEREQAAIEAELDGTGESFGAVRQEGLNRQLGLEENHQRLTRLLEAADARVKAAECELREAVAEEASGKLSEAVRVRDDAAEKLVAELDSLASAYGRLEYARGHLRSVAAVADEARAVAGLPCAEVPDEPVWTLEADVLVGLSAGPQRPREDAAIAAQRTRDELRASRTSQVNWAGRQAASGCPEAIERIPVELRDQARDLAARLSEPQALPVPDGYLLHPAR